MPRLLKITMLPAPGGHVAAGLAGSYEQHEFEVDNDFLLETVFDNDVWLQFVTTDDTEYAFPMQRIAGLAVK